MKIPKYLSLDAANKLTVSLILSTVDYYNATFCRLIEVHLKKFSEFRIPPPSCSEHSVFRSGYACTKWYPCGFVFFNVFTVAFPPTLFFTLFSRTNHHGCFISGHILLSFLKFFLLTFFAVVGPHSYEFPASPLTAYTDTYGAVKNILNNIFSKTPYEIDSTSARTCVCSTR